MTKLRLTLENGMYLDFVVYDDIAPITVKNFLELVDNHYYDSIVFHRIIKGFI